jgi:hypothetical protein
MTPSDIIIYAEDNIWDWHCYIDTLIGINIIFPRHYYHATINDMHTLLLFFFFSSHYWDTYDTVIRRHAHAIRIHSPARRRETYAEATDEGEETILRHASSSPGFPAIKTFFFSAFLPPAAIDVIDIEFFRHFRDSATIFSRSHPPFPSLAVDISSTWSRFRFAFDMKIH